jgi:hypothetical protein
MKRLSITLILALFFSVFCFAQIQTGNASYNSSKSGVTISHPSMSFGTHVRITNTSNNREVIATVDGRRVPESCIADISGEAGDAIGMAKSGLTQVRLEQLVTQQAVPIPAPVPAPPAPAQAAPPPQAAPAQPAPAQPAPAPATPPAAPDPVRQEPRIETIQLVPQPPQYIVLPNSDQFGREFFILLIIIVVLLTAILVVLICMYRTRWWPWHMPLWIRRHYRYIRNRRN